jgi:hypothetical protein
MRPTLFPIVLLPVLCTNLPAAPPNDNFASRISLAGSGVNTTGTNVEATTEPGENLRDGLFGATVWWSWLAPSTRWVRIDTGGSTFDTVLQVSTGATLASQTVMAFNDQAPGGLLADASSITFMAAAGTVYNLAVGGWEFVGADMGDISLHITTVNSVAPAWFPAALSFSPATADVSSGPLNVTAEFTIQSSSGSGTGWAGVGFGWEQGGSNRRFAGRPAFWNAGLSQGGPSRMSFTVPVYTPGGARTVWFRIIPDNGSDDLYFSGPDGGSGYALPAVPAVASILPVVSNCPMDPSDADAPNLTAFSITPDNATVTTAPAALQITAALTDAGSGVGAVNVLLRPGTAVSDLVVPLTLTSGTIQNGTWTGTLTVPALYPSGNYSALIEAIDTFCNGSSYGEFGTRDIPGAPDGTVDVPVIGGGAYESWAWTYRFGPEDPNPGPLDDANSDGIPNLLSYAFNLDPHNHVISAGFVPQGELAGAGALRRLRITFLRRKSSTNSGLTYSPQFTSAPSGLWQTAGGGTVTSVDSTWERVVVDDTVNVTADQRRLARVKVDYTP